MKSVAREAEYIKHSALGGVSNMHFSRGGAFASIGAMSLAGCPTPRWKPPIALAAAAVRTTASTRFCQGICIAAGRDVDAQPGHCGAGTV